MSDEAMIEKARQEIAEDGHIDDYSPALLREVERLRARVRELEVEKQEVASLHYSQSAVEELVAAAVAAFKEDAVSLVESDWCMKSS